MLRRGDLAGLLTCIFVLLFSSVANAQTGAGYVSSLLKDPAYCWSFYYGGPRYSGDPGEPRRNVQPSAYDIDEWSRGTVTWNNGVPRIKLGGSIAYRVPCPPRDEFAGAAIYIGGQLIKNSARVKSTETSAATGAVTNQFSDSGDPIGAGFVVGYNFAPWRNWVVGPFVSLDWLNQTVNHNFAGGQFLGTTTHWMITAGAKLGYNVAPNWLVYGHAGATWLNQDLNVNFATAASKNTTTPGFTLGLGAEVQPSSWRIGSYPVSLFLQYQHTWYATANFNTPASSPLFNYAFKRDDDTVKFGVNIYLQPLPAVAPRPALITK